MKNFKSYGFWTALSGAVVVLINSVGKCFGFSVEEEIVTNIIMAIAGMLVVFGVVSMPKKEDGKQTNDDSQTLEEEKDEIEKHGEEKDNTEVVSEDKPNE